jgi:hypothetical protein
MSSQEIARRAYEQLDARDRRIVDAWRGLGLSLMDALLESRAISEHLERRRPQDDAAGWYRRTLMRDPGLKIRITAEHEAAHAVVARNLGLRLLLVEITPEDGWSGRTRFEATNSREARAAIAIAPDVWLNHLRRHVWPTGDPDGIRKDMKIVAEATGGDRMNIYEARRRATEILFDRQDEVLAFTALLADKRRLEF